MSGTVEVIMMGLAIVSVAGDPNRDGCDDSVAGVG